MYIRRQIKFSLLFEDSWRFIVITAMWAILVVFAHDFLGWGLISVPIVPVSTIGIAVSIYLGFKSKQTYNRWWEGRKIFGDIVNKLRIFSNQVHSYLYTNEGKSAPLEVKKELIYNLLSWLIVLKVQLRKNSKFQKRKKDSIFNNMINHNDSLHELSRYLKSDEIQKFTSFSYPTTQILHNLGKLLEKAQKNGYLDSIRQCDMNQTLGEIYNNLGKCERIKSTPFPRVFAHLGQIFTWIFIILLPLGFLETFEDQGLKYIHNQLLQREYMFALVPFTVLISWVFYIMEKVSDSMEDPFEGGVNDVSISALTRITEIDLLESLGEKDIPKPIKPIDDVLH